MSPLSLKFTDCGAKLVMGPLEACPGAPGEKEEYNLLDLAD